MLSKVIGAIFRVVMIAVVTGVVVYVVMSASVPPAYTTQACESELRERVEMLELEFEAKAQMIRDQDGDGIPNANDLDSDGDGICNERGDHPFANPRRHDQSCSGEDPDDDGDDIDDIFERFGEHLDPTMPGTPAPAKE